MCEDLETHLHAAQYLNTLHAMLAKIEIVGLAQENAVTPQVQGSRRPNLGLRCY